MKNLILLIFVFIVSINIQSKESIFFVKGDDPYMPDSIIDRKYKMIEKFQKKIDNPFEDYFWPKTPVDLWDTNIRYYIITINDKNKYDLFVVNYIGYFYTVENFYFKRHGCNKIRRFYHLMQSENKEEILKMFD